MPIDIHASYPALNEPGSNASQNTPTAALTSIQANLGIYGPTKAESIAALILSTVSMNLVLLSKLIHL